MKTAKILGFTNPTAKGNCTIKVQVSNGLQLDPKPYYILSTPEAIEAAGVEVGSDVSDIVNSSVVETSTVIDDVTGEELHFRMLVPKI